MKKIPLALKENAYSIIVGKNIFSKLGSQIKTLKIGRDAVIVTNPVVKKLYGRVVEASLKKSGFSVKFFIVPDGEQSKSAAVAFDLIEKIVKYDVMKKVFIVALGGGVIGDLAGYVASAYKRGVPFVQVPTTFLAQIDSSIGGKVAVDLPVGKNLVGAFYQPKLVFSDVTALTTLTPRQILNGFAEAIKYGIIWDANLYEYFRKNYQKLIDLDLNGLTYVVETCSRIKAHVVVEDEKEIKGIRTILNFGHTVGHAIETVGGYDAYQHGEAVALGMRVATDISLQLGMISKKVDEDINQVFDMIGFPSKITGVKIPQVLKIMQHDKKFISGKNRFVLVKKIGQVQVVEGINLDVIKKAIRRYM